MARTVEEVEVMPPEAIAKLKAARAVAEVERCYAQYTPVQARDVRTERAGSGS